MPKLSKEIINAAILGFEEQKRRIDGEISSLRAMLASATTESAPTAVPARRKLSTAGRIIVAEGQRKPRAAGKSRAASETPAVSRPKRKLTAAGRAAIVAALKKRWAAKRAAEKK
jgi:hypothetical protein